MCVFFVKQKTEDEVETGDWSSDVCSADIKREEEIKKSRERMEKAKEKRQ